MKKIDPLCKEVEPLRLKLIKFHEIPYDKLYRYSHFESNVSFYEFMEKEPWINDILKTSFKKLPLLFSKCPKNISEEWYYGIVEWRLELGK